MTIMLELHESQRSDYDWEWAKGTELVRDRYPTVPIIPLFDFGASVLLYTDSGRYGRGLSCAEFTFLLDSEECVVGIAETRDFHHQGQAVPLWGNARIVPRDLDLYDQIQTILTTIRS